MKKLKYLLLALVVGGFFACNDLEVDPPNILTDKDIFNSESGVTAYLTRLYSELPIEDFKYNRTEGFNKFTAFWGLGANTGEWLQANDFRQWDINGNGFGYWPYSDIRNANYFLKYLGEYASKYTEEQVNAWLAEARFCRAYYYFGMVKRYGGVPIIKELQSYPEQTIEELRVPRDKEEAVYDFISEDLQWAVDHLPERSVSGRANKYVAAALKSRAMLFAGSIAKYGKDYFVGTPAHDAGLVGIPEGRATDYFKQSYDAAKLLEGHYDLYQKNPDLVQNYVDVFLDTNSPENVFIKDFVYMDNVEGSRHSWDAFASPRSSSSSYAGALCPTLDVVEMLGEVKVNDTQGNPIKFNAREDLLTTLAPRQRAIALFPGEVFRGKVVDVQAGLYENYSLTAEPIRTNDIYAKYKATNGKDYNIIGYDGIGTAASPSSPTGLHMRKYNNYKVSVAEANLWKSTQAWIDIRYAEVLLNRAEAAFELGTGEMKADALAQINKIRSRGGDNSLNLSELTIDKIRTERQCELAFENQTWWDLRRWRIGEQIREKRYHALYPYYIINENKWIFKKAEEPHRTGYTFNIIQYYEPIPGGEIGKNPNLLPNNPLY